MGRVIVIGGANVDIKGRAGDAMVAATSNIGEVTVSAGGVARNVAENLARLDVGVALMSAVGNDDHGRLVRESSAAAGVDVSMIATCELPTGAYLAVLDRRGELVAAINDMRAMDLLTVEHIEAQSLRLERAGFLVADCNIPVESLAWLCAFASEHAIRLLIEPISVPKAQKLLAFQRQSPVFAITPNRQQLEALTGESGTGQGIARLHRLGFTNIVVHCGRDGAIVSDGKSDPVEVPAFHVSEIADVTGAGDAAVAGLVCGHMTGLALLDAVRLGQAAAAIKLGARESVSSHINRARVSALVQTAMEQ